MIIELFKYLNNNCNYAVLRNYQGLPYLLNSRDIDIIIERGEFEKNIENIFKLILNIKYKIITRFKSDRIFTIICSKIDENSVEIIQIDFFFQTSLYGIIILDSRQLLESRIFNGEVYHVSKIYEFLDKYLYLKCLNKPYPNKYSELKEEIINSEFHNEKLKKITRCKSFEEIEKLSSSHLRKKILYNNFKNNALKQTHSIILFIGNYLKNAFSYKGYSIGFTGADGSGKTTIIQSIIEEIGKTYPSIGLFHFRPSLTPNLGEAVHAVNLKKEVDKEFSQPHRGKKTSKINSIIRLLYYSFDYTVGYFIRSRPYLQKRNVVIFDRYYTDIIVDSHRSRIFLNFKLLYWFGKWFIPKLNYNILLVADKNIILSRKQELDEKEIDQINKRIEYLSKKNGYYLVTNNGRPEEAMRKVLNIVFNEQHQKIIRRIKIR